MDILASYFDAEKQNKIKQYQLLNQYVQKGQTVLAGSSLMEQFPIYEFLQTQPIRGAVYNRGIGGTTTIEYLAVLDTCIVDLQPARVFLNIGTNDISGEDYQENGLIARYRLIVETIQARLPQARLYLMAYYPVNELHDFGNPYAREWLKTRTNARIRSANAAIEALAGRFGCRSIDLNAGLLDEQGQLKAEYSIEGVHLYANGYRVIFEALLPYLLED